MSVDVRGLKITIGGKPIVSDADMTIADGERVGLIGSSGSGKSMIAKAMLGLLPLTAVTNGSIDMGGTEIIGASERALADLRGRYVGAVFQNPAASLNPVMTVAQQIALPLRLHYDLTKAERADRVNALLSKVGLDLDMAGKYPHELSGGQQQRVGIATALITSPRFIIADEPTTALDSITQRQIVDLLTSLVDDAGASMLFITHDFSVLARATTRCYVLDAGPDDPRSYYQVAERLANTIPGGFRPNQYDNPNGPLSHYYTTGPEIWEATDHKVTHFVAGIGTGGTISGTGKYLKEASNGAVKVIGSDPEGSIYSASSRDEVHQYDIEGVGEDFYPKAFDRNITDDIVRVSDAEAFEMTRRLAGEEALLVGGSSGMAVASAIKYALANDLDENQIVVVLAPDSGRSYLEKIFNDDWMRANGYGDIVERTSKPSLAEQYLNGTPSDQGAGDGLHN